MRGIRAVSLGEVGLVLGKRIGLRIRHVGSLVLDDGFARLVRPGHFVRFVLVFVFEILMVRPHFANKYH